MGPEDRVVPRFAAEPPQEGIPYGRWADSLREAFVAATAAIDEEIGEVEEVRWYPDRSWSGRTYVPAAAPTSAGGEVFGYVSFASDTGDQPRTDFSAVAHYTEETAEQNPDWDLDLNDEEVGTWRGEEGRVATMSLVWGSPLEREGAIATAELAELVVDQCLLMEGRFTLLAPFNYRNDTLAVSLWNRRGDRVATELFEDEEE
jgi:hypothetical protein